jgi:peptidoglycan lytic transglycosylase G
MDERPSYLADHDPETDRHRRRIALVALLVAFIVVILAIAALANEYRGCKEPPAADGTTVDVVVDEGATGDEVVQQLADRGLIKCGGTLGNVLLRATGRANAILAGTYAISRGATLEEIVAQMTTPPDKVPTVRVTIPEGLRIASTFPGERSISSVIEEQTGVPADEVVRYAESGKPSVPPYLPAGTNPEGFLFPSTYEFVKKGLDAKTIVDEMLAEFGRQAKEAGLTQGAKRLGLTPYQVVVVASMIEREAQVEDDRPKIASVIYNRLDAGQTLGIDATLLYDDPSPDGRLSTSDLQSDSPYNTRLVAGLPPTPIASPGRSSLDAALQPADTPYFYYVLCPPDGNGVHRFAETYDEHLQNVQECLGG